MSRRALLLRWSWRDLRQRWVLVATIALVLALGTGVFASLGGTAQWRRATNDASFAATRVHDLRVALAAGNLAPTGQLRGVLDLLPDPGVVAAAEERLVWPTQAEVPGDGAGTDLVRGLVVSSGEDSAVDRVWVTGGEGGGAVVEAQFADARGLATTGAMTLSGGTTVRWTGIGQQPEYFTGGSGEGGDLGGMLDPGGFVVLFLPLADAQAVAGAPGQVNDLVVRLVPGADRDAVAAELEQALASGLPDTAATVTTRDEIPAYRMLYEDIGNDQQVWDLIAWITLLGASFASFNLINRIVEAQRREIGVGMALGVPRRELALRPLLVGLQVAVLGVVLGVLVSLVLNDALASMFQSVLPMPVWVVGFQLRSYVRAVAIGLALPMVATVIPVWRALRVEPVEAIRTGRFSTQQAGLARLGTRLPWPKGSIGQYPVRNLLRNARRSLLTSLAVASAIVVLIGVVGMLDSFTHAIDQADTALVWKAPDRLDVQLDTFVPDDSPVVAEVTGAPGVARVVGGLTLPGSIAGPDRPEESLDVVLGVLPFADAPWTPRVVRGEAPSPETGVLLAAKAARDLGVGPGDLVMLEHPRREGLGYVMTTSTLPVSGVHDGPLRAFAYLDASQASLFALDGVVNTLQVVPGGDGRAVQRALFGIPGVAAATPVSSLGDTFREMLAQYSGILRIMEGAVLLLALLISFNAVSIAVEERRREHATMFAFGLPTRTVLRMTAVEAITLGLVGTLLGIGIGWLVLRWMFAEMLPRTLPDLELQAYLSPGTLLLATAAGVLAVAVTPLFTLRRLRRMDVPATLRVVE